VIIYVYYLSTKFSLLSVKKDRPDFLPELAMLRPLPAGAEPCVAGRQGRVEAPMRSAFRQQPFHTNIFLPS